MRSTPLQGKASWIRRIPELAKHAKLVYFVEEPTSMRIPKGSLVFTCNREVAKSLRSSILIDSSFPGKEELYDHILYEGCRLGKLRPGDWVIISHLNGGDGDSITQKKVPDWIVLLVRPPVFETIQFAKILSREGIGASFLIGDERRLRRVVKRRILRFNPFRGNEVLITRHEYWQDLKFFAKLDGAFLIDPQGRVIDCAVQLDLGEVEIELSGGTRHYAVASATRAAGCTGVVVSEENKTISIFQEGRRVLQIGPLKK